MKSIFYDRSAMKILITMAIACFMLINCSIQWQQKFEPLKFGSNKPHLLFHIGSRQRISHNIGYGYWLLSPQRALVTESQHQKVFSSIRHRYQTTQKDLYVNVLNHDGSKLIHQEIKDNMYNIATQIKYLYEENKDKRHEFGVQIQMGDFNRQQQANSVFAKDNEQEVNKIFKKGDLMWFLNIAVENNDLRLINHKDYISPTSFKLIKKSNNEIHVQIQKLVLQKNGQYDFDKTQTIKVVSQDGQQMNMFGFTINITQAYDARNYIEQVQHLIQLESYPQLNILRKNDSKIVQWQNKQIQQMKKKKFDNKYTYVMIYGKVKRQSLLEGKKGSRKPSILITNSSYTEFPQKTFSAYGLQNLQSLVPSSLQKQSFLSHVIFNLLGGLTYYQGKLFTQNSIISHQHDYSFGFTPSRLIFPRSFLWDDGFHMTVMANLKPQLTMQVLHNWLKKVDIFGWIGREQIRGMEMGSLMPDSRFIYQDVFQLNPPTIVLPILKLLQSQQKHNAQISSELKTLLTKHFPSLQKHFRYFIKTQSHFDLSYKQDLQKNIKYRWRCKDECAKGNFMGSGLDDYPRVQNQKQISKQHVDLSSWLYLFSDSLQRIANYTSNTKSSQFYNKWKYELRDKIIQDCLDKDDMLFKDLAVKQQKKYIDTKVNKTGYINLFPFFVGLLTPKQGQQTQKESQILSALNRTLDIMMDQKLLMSAGGIRSLSLSDSQYATEENYWRGAVWMPINYMILRACKKYYWDIQPSQIRDKIRHLYHQLRKRLIQTVQTNFQKSGYLFQNYIEGQGNRGYPFYGWTALIATILLEDY